jgi:hypothetical protein
VNKYIILTIFVVPILFSSSFDFKLDEFTFDIPLDWLPGTNQEDRLVGEYSYNEDTKEFTAEIDGVEIVLCGVPQLLYEHFSSSASQDEYFQNYIDENFVC